MLIRLIVIAALAAFQLTSLPAQNRLLLLGKGDSLGSIRYVDDDYYGASFRYNIPKPPLTISGAVPFEVKFVSLANEAVNDFQTNHLHGYGMYELNSLWLAGHQRVAYSSLSYDIGWEEQAKAANYLKILVIERPVIRDALYNWLMPVYKVAFAAMSTPEQNAYLTAFRKAVTYLEEFDLAKENEAAESSEFVYNRGYLNAFLYRRVSKNEITREDCLYWMKRIITDFESVLRKNPTDADEYILGQVMSYGYYTAWYYTEYEQPGKPPVVMRKENEQYRVLQDVRFDDHYKMFDNMIFGYVRISEDSVQRAVFYCDSMKYTYTTSAFKEYPVTYIPIGSGHNRRLMLVSGWTEIPDRKYGSQVMAKCSVIDLDSGTVVAGNMLVPAQIEYDPDTDQDVYLFNGNLKSEIIYCDSETNLWGVRDAYGNELLPAKYRSVESTETPGVYKVNGKKKVKVRKK